MRVEVVQELGGVAFEHRRGVILVVDQVAQARMVVVRRIVLLDSGVGGVVERQLGVGEVSHEYSFPLE